MASASLRKLDRPYLHVLGGKKCISVHHLFISSPHALFKALSTIQTKLPRVNQGLTWVELIHTGFGSVDANLPGLNSGKFNQLVEVG